MANLSEIKQVLARFALLFPNYTPADVVSTAKVWHEVLGHIPGDELMAAAIAAASNPGQAFAPSVGEVMGCVIQLRNDVNKTPTADEAWRQIIKSQNDFGYYRCEEYLANSVPKGKNWSMEHLAGCSDCNEEGMKLHPLVKKVAKRFGWPKFPGDNLEADRAHFMRAYKEEMDRESIRQSQPQMVQQYLESKSAPMLESGE